MSRNRTLLETDKEDTTKILPTNTSTSSLHRKPSKKEKEKEKEKEKGKGKGKNKKKKTKVSPNDTPTHSPRHSLLRKRKEKDSAQFSPTGSLPPSPLHKSPRREKDDSISTSSHFSSPRGRGFFSKPVNFLLPRSRSAQEGLAYTTNKEKPTFYSDRDLRNNPTHSSRSEIFLPKQAESENKHDSSDSFLSLKRSFIKRWGAQTEEVDQEKEKEVEAKVTSEDTVILNLHEELATYVNETLMHKEERDSKHNSYTEDKGTDIAETTTEACSSPSSRSDISLGSSSEDYEIRDKFKGKQTKNKKNNFEIISSRTAKYILFDSLSEEDIESIYAQTQLKIPPYSEGALGEGAFGKVMVVKVLSHKNFAEGTWLAIKRVKTDDNSLFKKNDHLKISEMTHNERKLVDAIYKQDISGVVTILDTIEIVNDNIVTRSVNKLLMKDPSMPHFFHIMEIYPLTGKDFINCLLHQHKFGNYTINENDQIFLILQIALALISVLRKLHKKRVYHLDLKPENIFLDFPKMDNEKSVSVLLSDFGAAQALNAENETRLMVSNLADSRYYPPETLSVPRNHADKALSTDKNNKRYALKDMWSLGIILLELLNPNLAAEFTLLADRYAHAAKNGVRTQYNTKIKAYDKAVGLLNKFFESNKFIPQSFKLLTQGLLQPDWARRTRIEKTLKLIKLAESEFNQTNGYINAADLLKIILDHKNETRRQNEDAKYNINTPSKAEVNKVRRKSPRLPLSPLLFKEFRENKQNGGGGSEIITQTPGRKKLQ